MKQRWVFNLLLLLATVLGTGVAHAQLNAYVANSGDTSLRIIDTATNTETSHISGTGSRSLRLSADGKRLFSVNGNAVQIIDTTTNAVIASVPTGNIVTAAAPTNQGTLYTCNNGRGPLRN